MSLVPTSSSVGGDMSHIVPVYIRWLHQYDRTASFLKDCGESLYQAYIELRCRKTDYNAVYIRIYDNMDKILVSHATEKIG